MIAEILSSVFSGVLSGGATGLLGMGIQMWSEASKRESDLKVLTLQNEQALAMRRMDMDQQRDLANITADSADRLATIAAQSRADETAGADYLASQQNDRATYLSPAAQDWPTTGGVWPIRIAAMTRVLMALVDTFRGVIRPGVTVYSMVLLTLMLYWVRDLYNRGGLVMTPAQAMQLAGEVIGTATYIATTTVVWWFGRRPEAQLRK